MGTVMHAPRLMSTLTKQCLAAFTLYAVQPDRSSTDLVNVVARMANISSQSIIVYLPCHAVQLTPPVRIFVFSYLYICISVCVVYISVCVSVATSLVKQVAQLSQRDRAAGWVSYGQKWKTVNGRQHFTDIIGLSSTAMT